MKLDEAQIIAEKVLEIVRQSSSKAEIAGSIRRKKPEVKDIEIVAIIDDYDKLFEMLSKVGRFIKPGVPDIIDWPPKKNSKYIRMFLNEEIKLDLFIANEDNWGPLFCMRTGSATNAKGNAFQGFVPKMFSMWKKASNGGKMTNCQPTMPDGTQLSVSTEELFFELCGVEFVPPELRIDAKAVKKKEKI